MLLAFYIANFSTSLFNITETVAWEQIISVHAVNQVSIKSINIEKLNVLAVLN